MELGQYKAYGGLSEPAGQGHFNMDDWIYDCGKASESRDHWIQYIWSTLWHY